MTHFLLWRLAIVLIMYPRKKISSNNPTRINMSKNNNVKMENDGFVKGFNNVRLPVIYNAKKITVMEIAPKNKPNIKSFPYQFKPIRLNFSRLINRHTSNVAINPPKVPNPFVNRKTHSLLPSISIDIDRKSTRLNSSHVSISYAVFCLKKKKNK